MPSGIIWLTWSLRFLIGAFFIFSGFVKGIDPWGTYYKVAEYISLSGIEIWGNLKLVGVFFLNSFEFVLGVFIFFGCFRRWTIIWGLLFMAVMLPLTLWIAVANPVADCGCFGDALKLTNWETFWKNIILTAGLIFLLKFNTSVHCLITPALQWIFLTISAVFIVIIEFLGYNYQPLIDFRPFPIGSQLTESMDEDEPEYLFVYGKGEERKYITSEEDLPGKDWEFIGREELKRNNQTSQRESKNEFKIWTVEENEDAISEALDPEGKELIILMPDLAKVSPATTWKLNSLDQWSNKNDVKLIAVVSGSKEEFDEWKDLAMPDYPVYQADDTQIKEIARGNPAVIYLIDGKIIWKSTLSFINVDDFLSPDTGNDAENFDIDNDLILYNLTIIYIICIIVLITLSFTPDFFKFIFIKRRKINHDDKIHHE